MQLNWKFQFEHAGFIAAKEKGFYKDVGLDVDIKEVTLDSDILNELNNGNATYALYDLSLTHLKRNQDSVRLIANYFKRSALVFITTQDIVTPEDLINKVVMADAQQLESSTLSTLLQKFKINKNQYIFKQHSFSSDDFIEGRVDAISAYLSNEVYSVRKSKKPYNIIDPSVYGIYGSGLNLFTTLNETIDNPKRVEKFLEASRKGWEYALNNKEEIVDIIYSKYSSKKSKEALLFEATQIEKLIMPELYNIGEINRILMQRAVDNLKTDGVIEDNFEISKIIYNPKNTKPDFSFSLKQKEYLSKKKEITMCIDPDWMPYEKIQNGKHIGMTSEYVPLLSERMGIPIKLVPTKTWAQSIEYAKQRKCDIFSLAMSTPSRLEYMNFTMPYISFPLVIATKMDKFFVLNPEELITKEKIGIVKGYSIGELLKTKYPNHKIVDVNSLEEGMDLVEKGELFGFVGALPTVVYSIQNRYIGELKVAGKFDWNIELSIGVRNDDQTLFELFQKTVQSIEESKKQEILNRYISVKVENGFDYKLFYQVLAVFVLILLLGFYRHRQVVKYNNELKEQKLKLQDTQKKLEESISGFEVLLDSVIEAVFVFKDQKCVDLNNVALKMFKYTSKDEVIGKPIQEFLTSISYKKVSEMLKEESTEAYEIKAVKSDGSTFDVIVKGRDAVINSQNVRISAVVDISEMKDKENLLFRQSKMASMGEMLENIAHQWRQPLSSISTLSTASQVKKELGISKTEEEIEDLIKINETAQYLSQTIEDFRDFFKPDKKKSKFYVSKAVVKTLKLLEGMIKNEDIKVIFTKKDDFEITSYENEFTQALVNLIYNSKDAMQNKKEQRYVFIDVQKSENYVAINVYDNGGGIKDSIINNIFEPYFTTKHKSQGTGIGLYMTHQIVEKHMQGSITAQNISYDYEGTKHRGALFTIKLPL